VDRCQKLFESIFLHIYLKIIIRTSNRQPSTKYNLKVCSQCCFPLLPPLEWGEGQREAAADPDVEFTAAANRPRRQTTAPFVLGGGSRGRPKQRKNNSSDSHPKGNLVVSNDVTTMSEQKCQFRSCKMNNKPPQI
jgi:hypothetical protein